MIIEDENAILPASQTSEISPVRKRKAKDNLNQNEVNKIQNIKINEEKSKKYKKWQKTQKIAIDNVLNFIRIKTNILE